MRLSIYKPGQPADSLCASQSKPLPRLPVISYTNRSHYICHYAFLPLNPGRALLPDPQLRYLGSVKRARPSIYPPTPIPGRGRMARLTTEGEEAGANKFDSFSQAIPPVEKPTHWRAG
jgi:hypothetical protein